MEKTTNYDRFKTVTANRELNERHLKTLMASIGENNLLHLNPIVVNEKNEIIDGQHRLESARRLGVPIFFIIGNVNKSDISTLNRVQKKWTSMDYVNFYTIEKRPGFHLLSKFLFEHPNLGLSTVLCLISDTGNREIDNIRSGSVNVLNYDQACKIAHAIDELSKHYDFINERSFVIALRRFWDHPEFDFSHLKRKLEEGLSRRFVKCYTIAEYIDMIQEIYNTHMHSKNHLNIKK